jgi:hypothetical protein
MKKIIFAFAFTSLLWVKNQFVNNYKKQVQVVINLNEIKDDKVMVTVNAPSITTDEITYHIPKQFQEPTQETIMADTLKI